MCGLAWWVRRFARRSPLAFGKSQDFWLADWRHDDRGRKKHEEFIHDKSIKVTVYDSKRTVIYNGEEWSLSALAKVLLKRNSTVQGTLHFSYNGETISDLRERLEEENNY